MIKRNKNSIIVLEGISLIARTTNTNSGILNTNRYIMNNLKEHVLPFVPIADNFFL